MDLNIISGGWVTLALINANLAQTKKQSGVLWLFISLLIGPFATLILAFIKADGFLKKD